MRRLWRCLCPVGELDATSRRATAPPEGIGSTILAALRKSEPLKINNIDEELKPALAFYEANGYKQVLEQFEMIKTL